MIFSFKSFCNSRGNSYIPCLLLTITFCFTCGESKIWLKKAKFWKYYVHGFLQNFLFLFMSLLKTPIVESTNILAGIYFIFLKKCPGANLKVFRYQIWTSVKRSEKELSSTTNFSIFLQLHSSNFSLKLYQKPHIYQNYEKNQVWRSLVQVRSKKLFPETIMDKIFEAALVFMWNTLLQENFDCYFSAVFC